MLLKTVFTNSAIQVINFLGSIAAARLLGPEGRGHLALVLLYPQFIANLIFGGLDRAASVLGGTRRLSSPLYTAGSLSVLLAIPALLIAYVVISSEVSDPTLRGWSYLYCAYVPALYFFNLMVALFAGTGDFSRYNLARLSYYLAYAGLLVVLIVLPLSRLGVFVTANLGAVYTAFAISLGLMLASGITPKSSPLVAVRRDATALIRSAGVFALPVGMAHVSANLYQILLSHLADASALGLFVVYFSYGRLVSGVAGAINVRTFQSSIAGQDGGFARVFRMSAVIYVLLAVLLFVVAPLAIRLLYGEGFVGDAGVARLLILSAVCFFLSEMLAEYYKGKEKVAADVWSQVLYCSVVAMLGFWLVPSHGIGGMAAAVVVADAARLMLLATLAPNVSGVSIEQLVRFSRQDLQDVAQGVKRALVPR
jgi:PST family polysaccharide transporter